MYLCNRVKPSWRPSCSSQVACFQNAREAQTFHWMFSQIPVIHDLRTWKMRVNPNHLIKQVCVHPRNRIPCRPLLIFWTSQCPTAGSLHFAFCICYIIVISRQKGNYGTGTNSFVSMFQCSSDTPSKDTAQQ